MTNVMAQEEAKVLWEYNQREALMSDYIAHNHQSLRKHLEGVATLAGINAQKIGMEQYGRLLGLLHDFGKYSSEFQKYITDSIKKNDAEFNPDEDEEFEDPSGRRGRIDHSTAGAQYLSSLIGRSNARKILGQVLSLCLVSHHSGLIDCLATNNDGTWDSYTERLSKADSKTHMKECASNGDKYILEKINDLLRDDSLSAPFEKICHHIAAACPRQSQTIGRFQLGLLIRFLFSSLIDADCQDTADSEKPAAAQHRQRGDYRPWNVLTDRLENTYRALESKNTCVRTDTERAVNKVRSEVSGSCLSAAHHERGLFTLTVPTGGGKTLASLRFALHHAKKHSMDRIIYVVPFTTIIDQNAKVIRGVLEPDECPKDSGRIVLEHHSNIGADVQTWKEKLLTENWDAPVVLTTMVQFLETIFGEGTRGARRMHQLASAVIIFDEVQTLPVKCVHLFNNAINFLVDHCRSTVVLCTATQPLLGRVEETKGALQLTEGNEIISDIGKLYADLKRVSVHDCRRSLGWKHSEIAEFAHEQAEKEGNCLVVVNTKKAARLIFEGVKKKRCRSFYLTTGMCPAHRREVFDTVRRKLDAGERIICISTQLVEAGVDISFKSVVRMLAGLDSIAQAAGRCNRHGSEGTGEVFIINDAEENLEHLEDIKVGKENTDRVLNDYKDDQSKYNSDPISPKMLEWYYENYFYSRSDKMGYPVKAGRNDTLLNMLGPNSSAVADYQRTHDGKMPAINLHQSFMTAARHFRSIDAPTQSVIVSYGEKGRNLVYRLCAAFEVQRQHALFRTAQQYSVNLFPYEFNKLLRQRALRRVQQDTEIFYLDSQYYSKITGISLEPVEREEQFEDEYIT